jgi:amidohydrolase
MGYIENMKWKLDAIIETLYADPELSYNEVRSSELLCSFLAAEGFSIKRDVAKIKNSFIAEYGSASPRIAYLCEYNAIDKIGHGCGHNVSSAISIGAAAGVKQALQFTDGSVAVFGCPAEDKFHSKISMLNSGLFDDIDAVLYAHAGEKTSESGSSLGMTVLYFDFTGKEAHVSINFREGINALYPCILFLRLVEEVKEKHEGRIFTNSIIREGGKDIAMIPGETKCAVMIKSQDKAVIDSACEEIINCAKFASKLYRCDVTFNYPEVEYMPFKTNEELSKILSHNLKESGITNIHGPITISTSLDFGNISHKIPSVQPYIGICDEGIKYFTKEFADSTIKELAKDNALKAACALALTGIDIIQQPSILKK